MTSKQFLISNNQTFFQQVIRLSLSFITRFLLLMPLFYSSMVSAQLQLQIIPADKDTTFINKEFVYQREHSTKFSLTENIKTALAELQKKGYWSASIDSLTEKDSAYTAFLYVGELIEWALVENGNIDENALDAVGFSPRFYKNKILNLDKINGLKQQLLTYAENNGYPFARVWLDEIVIDKGKVSAKLFWNKQRFITFDAIGIEGDAKISKAYLANFLGIKQGEPYNESLLKSARARLRTIPFLKEKRGLAVIFKGNEAKVTLFLEKRNASRFDLLVGFLPANEFTGRPLITGSFQGVLYNPFGTGKMIGIDWQRLKAETSRLQVQFEYPYVLNLPFGFDGKMDIYRRDSTLQDTKFDIGVQYLFQGNNYFKVFWKSIANNILTINEAQIIQNRRLPSNLDILNTALGVAYSYQNLNNRINPTSGFSLQIQSGAGIKQIRQNAAIANLKDNNQPNFDFTTLYDSLKTRTFQVNSEAMIAYYQPLGKRATIKASIQSGWLFSQDSLYQNEVYRIGGNRILRGFDEESILSSLYGVLTIEPRLLLNQNSYLFAFLDYGYLENKTIGNQVEDFPLGFGLGLSLGTPAGIVRVSYAVGKQLEQPIDFRSAKIHFGYVNYF